MESESSKPAKGLKRIPRKYQKLIDSGRWEWVSKQGQEEGSIILVGLRRKSTKKVRWMATPLLLRRPQIPVDKPAAG